MIKMHISFAKVQKNGTFVLNNKNKYTKYAKQCFT